MARITRRRLLKISGAGAVAAQTGGLGEGIQEVVLHEERAVLRKEMVPVERVRLRTRRVQEDSTVRDEVHRERIEVEPDQQFASNRPDDPGNRRR